MKILKIFFMALFLLLYYYESNYAWGNKKTLKELVDLAPVIVIGKVTNVESKFGENYGRKDFIFTYVTFEIETALKGTTKGQTIIIKIPGGQIGNVAIGGESGDRFKKDDEALLFLREKDKIYYSICSSSGNLSIITKNDEKLIDCSLLKNNNSMVEKAENIVCIINSFLLKEGVK